jgi:hypothetical protein
MWFAAPTFASMTKPTVQADAARANRAYTERGILLFEKRDINTDTIVNQPGFTVIVSINPYTLVPGSTLTVEDNVMDPGGGYDNYSRYGYIKLQNVIAYSYTWREIAPPTGYLVDSTPHLIDVPNGLSVRVVHKNLPVTLVPASSGNSLWIMIGIFAALISVFVIWRGRRSGFAIRR